MTATFLVLTMKFAFYNSLIGFIRIGYNNEGICSLKTCEIEDGENEPSELTERTFGQLEEYFSGKRKVFDLPFKMNGTAFQMKVWQELLKIPYGDTVSYSEIAERIGCPEGARAVGGAVHNNLLWIIVPCHRVVGKNGKLTGYAGGTEMKKTLLELEKTQNN